MKKLIFIIHRDFGIIHYMVQDSCERLKNYYSLDDKLTTLQRLNSIDVPEYNGFKVNKKVSSLFIVNRGEALFATSWRENPESRESTAVVKAHSGEFVFYLPGEPMLVKLEEGSEVSLFELGE